MKMKRILALALMLAMLTLCAAAAEESAPVMLADNGEVGVYLTGIDPEGFWGYTLEVLLVNNTDRELMFKVDGGRVNGYASDPFWATTVAAGAQDEAEISWMDMASDGITGDVTRIDLLFEIYDMEDLNAEDVLNEWLTVYPMGEENAQVIERGILETDVVVYERDFGFMVITEAGYDEDGGYTAKLYLKNLTDSSLSVNLRNCHVNGAECDPFWATLIPAQAQAVAVLEWSADKLADCGVTEVTELQMELSAYDFDDWSIPVFMEETITVNP